MTTSAISTPVSAGTPARPEPRHPNGPHAGALAIITTALVVAAVALPGVITGHQGYVLPTAIPGEVRAYFDTSADAARLTALLQFAAAIPLGILTATLYAHLRRLGITVPGPSIAMFGGVAASAAMLISTSALYAAAELGDPARGVSGEVLSALTVLAFAAGGAGYVVPLGLLVAGVAVPAYILRLVPRPLALAGLVVALVCEVATLDLLSHGFDPLLPIGRFGSLAWLIAVGFILPKAVRQRTGRAPARRVGASVAS
ncbi:MAG: hypothetical protein V9G19_02495 [Tetrasphaera sp.]